jgi:hypothetical protein
MTYIPFSIGPDTADSNAELIGVNNGYTGQNPEHKANLKRHIT